MPIYKISFFKNMVVVFSFKKIDYYVFIAEQLGKNKFLNEISYKNLKFLNGPKFNWFISISYTIKKITQNFHTQI